MAFIGFGGFAFFFQLFFLFFGCNTLHSFCAPACSPACNTLHSQLGLRRAQNGVLVRLANSAHSAYEASLF
ncbi:hypothetical protein PM02_02240 [Sulfitobacter mediterraneus]|uniref:Uncharacterized protein n=1 Tax=Sulfitobacter mediterraneus TaxID=83219 RepID=A0A061SUJ4_9RHOB|nr:hypothetical protein PM02_02240 [Sulfitobacter mediterraneus]